MSSAVDICNLALSRVGDEASLSGLAPPEGSVEADHCKRWYPIARNALFEAHNWNFLTRRMRLAKLQTDSFEWAYAYALPHDVLHAIAVYSTNDPEHTCDFQIESTSTGGVLYTNCADAILRYTQVTDEAERFPPLFVDALAWLLASYLAGAVIRGNGGLQVASNLAKAYQAALALAIQRDTIQRQKPMAHYPAWLTFRRGLPDGTN